MEGLDDLVGVIYEAGALPELWGTMLDHIASRVGARGGNLIVSAAQGTVITPSPSTAEVTREFDAQGWNAHNTRVSRLLQRADHPGFLTDADLHSPEELRSLPIYTEFLTPRRADAGAATVIMGAHHDGIVLTMEAFGDHDEAHKAVPLLNRLRPHFARAAVISSRIQSAQASTLAETFDALSVPVALLDPKGKVMAATQRFADLMDDVVLDGQDRLRLTDPEADARLSSALGGISREHTGASIAVKDRENVGVAVLHLVPARRNARDLFSNLASFAILARPDNKSLPSVDILSGLFDLTPTEARVARGIALGRTTADLTQDLNITQETIKSHLKRVFAKTSTRRQGDLALLVTGFS